MLILKDYAQKISIFIYLKFPNEGAQSVFLYKYPQDLQIYYYKKRSQYHTKAAIY